MMEGVSVMSGQQERQRAANATGHGGLAIEIDPMPERGQQKSLYSYSERRPIDDTLGVNGASGRSDEDDKYVPVDGVPEGYPQLNFRPLTLKNWFLGLTISFFALCLAAVVTLAAISYFQPSRLHFHTKAAHLAVSYIPGIVGTITTIWFTAVVQSYNRFIPYVAMASVPRNVGGDVNARRLIYNLNALAVMTFRPGIVISLLKHGHGMTFFVNTIFQLVMLFMTPFKGAFIQVTEDPDANGWMTNISRGFAYALSILYFVLIVSTFGIIWRLWGVQTGLKWDPAPIAAQLALIHQSNIFPAFNGMEFSAFNEIGDIISRWGQDYGVLRLGYWMNKNDERDIIHGVRFLRPDGRSTSAAHENRLYMDWKGERHVTHIGHKYPDYCLQDPYNTQTAPITRDGELICSPQYLRYRLGNFYFTPYWCWPTRAIAVVRIIVSITYIINHKVNNPIVISPLLSSTTDPNNVLGRWETGTLFAFLPAFLFSAFNATFTFSNIITKFMQPIAGMDVQGGASPRDSVLVDYISPDPLTSIYKAIKKKHYRVAWLSQLGLWCTATPIVAARIFNRLKVGENYVMILQPVDFYVAFVILCFYVVAQWYATPPPHYRAPRVVYNLVDTVSLCYQSNILEFSEFSASGKAEKYDELEIQVKAADRRFQFGMYRGMDSRMHIGFDVTERQFPDGSILRPVDLFRLGMNSEDRQRKRLLDRCIRRPKIIQCSGYLAANAGEIRQRDERQAQHGVITDHTDSHVLTSPVSQSGGVVKGTRRKGTADAADLAEHEIPNTTTRTSAV